jgi:signal transduction histidine kinase
MRLFPRKSIYGKLIGLIAILMTLIVGVLTTYFPSRQIAEQTQGLVGKAEMYESLMGRQLQSAVAFRDRETAREVLSSLAADQDVSSAALYASDGRPLFGVGKYEPTRPAAKPSRQTWQASDRVTVVSRVSSPEGPWGTLVIELSTDRLRASRRDITITAVIVGGLALLGGVAAAWVIARSLARRLRRMADVAEAVTAGQLEQQPIQDATDDEIGTLARAFNAMLSRLRTSIADIHEANRTLEARVRERTSQLSAANEQLKQEMESRSKIEVELRHAQKLESVGRLAAGIAHEINTPIQFVGNNITFLENTFKDLIELSATYRQLCRKGSEQLLTADDLGVLEEAESAADLDYVTQNVPRSIASTQDGIARVAKIVQSMKSFAHPDRGEKTTADVNAALNSTLTVASNELKYVADIETEFAELPAVPCFLSDLNQVFLNLFINAAHAVGDVVGKSGGKGVIRVKTARQGDSIVVTISDSGTGIPEQVRDRIFDPFFTTKEVGKGTGQGLALARTIVVEKHGGAISFETEMGKGTTFKIVLPLLQEARNHSEDAA